MNPFVPASLQQDLILASASPRRRALLEGLGFAFAVVPSDYPEDDGDLSPADAARPGGVQTASAESCR